MLDRLLGNPVLVIIGGIIVAAAVVLWYRHDSRNNRIARLRRGERVDD